MTHVSIIAKKFYDFLDNPPEKLPSGIYAFDMKEGGFEYGDLNTVGGLTGATKSTLVNSMAFGIAKYFSKNKIEKSVAIITLEMSDVLVFARQFSGETYIPFRRLKTEGKEVLEKETYRVKEALERIHDYPLHIIDANCGTIEELEGIIRSYLITYNTQVFVLDYIQLVSSLKWNNAGRAQEMAAISRRLKKLAQDLKLCIIIVTQYARGASADENIENRLFKAKESGQIENDSSFFSDISFKSYVSLKRKYEKLNMLPAPPYNYAAISLLKYRHGETGDFPLCYVPNYYKYVNAQYATDTVEHLFCPQHQSVILRKNQTDGSYFCLECDYIIPPQCGTCVSGITFYTVTAENNFDYEFAAACPHCGQGIEAVDRVKRMNSLIDSEIDRIPIIRFASL